MIRVTLRKVIIEQHSLARLSHSRVLKLPALAREARGACDTRPGPPLAAPPEAAEAAGHGDHAGTMAGRGAGPATVAKSGLPGLLTQLTPRAVIPAATGVQSSDANH